MVIVAGDCACAERPRALRDYKTKMPSENQCIARLAIANSAGNQGDTDRARNSSHESMAKRLPQGYYSSKINGTTWEVPDRYQELTPINSGKELFPLVFSIILLFYCILYSYRCIWASMLSTGYQIRDKSRHQETLCTI